MKGGLGNLMQQAQQMQKKMQELQDEVAGLEVTGESGGGMVKVTLTGRNDARKVEIDPEAFRDDREMLEDLIAAAINDAVARLEEMRQEKMGSLAGGLNLPPGFKLEL